MYIDQQMNGAQVGRAGKAQGHRHSVLSKSKVQPLEEKLHSIYSIINS